MPCWWTWTCVVMLDEVCYSDALLCVHSRFRFCISALKSLQLAACNERAVGGPCLDLFQNMLCFRVADAMNAEPEPIKRSCARVNPGYIVRLVIVSEGHIMLLFQRNPYSLVYSAACRLAWFLLLLPCFLELSLTTVYCQLRSISNHFLETVEDILVSVARLSTQRVCDNFVD